MAQTNLQKSPGLFPPEEKFWQRYSRHQEFPLSSVGSLAIHSLVIGGMILAGLLANMKWHDEGERPPTMDLVMPEGGGFGMPGLGGGPGTEGPLQLAKGPKENIEPNNPLIENPEKPIPENFKLEKPKLDPFEVNPPDLPKETEPDAFATVEDIKKIAEAQEKIRQAMKLAKEAGNKPGAGGNEKGSGPTGPGIGMGKGPGQGGNPGMGRIMTKAEIFANRWRFDMVGNGKQQADKFLAAGVILVVMEPNGGFGVIRDLNRRPATIRRENLELFKDAVQWESKNPNAVMQLAQELRIKIGVPYFKILLPKEREEKMASLEESYAKSKGKTSRDVKETWFGFRLANGVYTPYVMSQEYWQ